MNRPSTELCQRQEQSRAVASGEEDRLLHEALPSQMQLAILEVLKNRALAGDVRVAAFLFERLYGRPGAAPRPSPAEVADAAEYDLNNLDNAEFEVLQGLIQKCKRVP